MLLNFLKAFFFVCTEQEIQITASFKLLSINPLYAVHITSVV